MNFADLLLAHVERRRTARARIRAAVESTFEVTTSNKDRVRRAEVARTVADAEGVRVVNNAWQRQVARVVVEMGAEMVKPRNKRYFRKLRRRGPTPP